MLVEDFILEIEKQVEGFSTRVKDATRGLNGDQLNWSPQAGDRWSVAQVIKHVMISNRLYIPELQRVLKVADMGQPRLVVKYTWFGRLLSKKVGPNSSSRVPKLLEPGSGPFGVDVVDHFSRQQDELLVLIKKASDKDIVSTKIRNPIVPICCMNLADVFRVLERHSEHHMLQIERLIREPRFPAQAEASPMTTSNDSFLG